MQHAPDERWMLLCKEASTELNPEKLLELIREINRLIEERQLRSKKQE
jgi:hypothetical protein